MEQAMTKKQKITVSIIGIFLVLITILGITYAYFLTKIQGNTNESSVIISAANLLLKYTDGNGIIEPQEDILPVTTIESKTFSVENSGTDTINSYGVYLENVINNFERTEDVIITLRCEIFDTVAREYLEGNCNGLTDTEYPTMNSLLVTNSIPINIRHDYTLIIDYANEPEIDQSNDMNKTIKGKIQIYDTNDTVDISGTIANSTEGDYILLDDSQTSQIINGTYKLVGIGPDTHTISVKNDSKNEDEEIITTTKGSKTLLVEFNNEEKLDGNTLYITNTSDEIILNITSIATELTVSLGS